MWLPAGVTSRISTKLFQLNHQYKRWTLKDYSLQNFQVEVNSKSKGAFLFRHIRTPKHWPAERERDLRFFLFNSAHLIAAHKSPSLCWLSQPLMLSQLTPGSIDFWKTSIHANSKQWYCLKSALSWTSWLVTPSCKLLIVGSLTRWRSGCVRLEETSIKRNTFHCKKKTN